MTSERLFHMNNKDRKFGYSQNRIEKRHLHNPKKTPLNITYDPLLIKTHKNPDVNPNCINKVDIELQWMLDIITISNQKIIDMERKQQELEQNISFLNTIVYHLLNQEQKIEVLNQEQNIEILNP